MPKISAVGQAAGKIANRRFGVFLKSARKKHGWTQAQLAAQLGVNELTVRRWESGDSGPTKTHLEAIAALLEVSKDELIARALEREGTLIKWGEWQTPSGANYDTLPLLVEHNGKMPLPIPPQAKIVGVRVANLAATLCEQDTLVLCHEAEYETDTPYIVELEDGSAIAARLALDTNKRLVFVPFGKDDQNYSFGSVKVLGTILCYLTGRLASDH